MGRQKAKRREGWGEERGRGDGWGGVSKLVSKQVNKVISRQIGLLMAST